MSSSIELVIAANAMGGCRVYCFNMVASLPMEYYAIKTAELMPGRQSGIYLFFTAMQAAAAARTAPTANPIT